MQQQIGVGKEHCVPGPKLLDGEKIIFKTVHDPFRLAAPTEEKGGGVLQEGRGKGR